MRNNKVQVTAQVVYLPEQSFPEKYRFMWSYEIVIFNQGDQILQLLNRYWRITDLTGKVEEVRGTGVVGLQPIIKPGKQFVYGSFCQLHTPQGSMQGQYEMQTLEEERFFVDIPKFELVCPDSVTADFRSRLH